MMGVKWGVETMGMEKKRAARKRCSSLPSQTDKLQRQLPLLLFAEAAAGSAPLQAKPCIATQKNSKQHKYRHNCRFVSGF